jgi:hypothetical protein
VSVVVKFSRIVDGAPAHKVMNMLHELFHRYDLLCEKHGTFKVLPRIILQSTDTAAEKGPSFMHHATGISPPSRLLSGLPVMMIN